MQALQQAVTHFLDFHRGVVNITVHVIGFALLFYSIYKLDWRIFALSVILLESGHIYNHGKGVKPYDFRISTLLWRGFIFILLVAISYFVMRSFA